VTTNKEWTEQRKKENCTCWQWHHDECPNFDFKQGYANLIGDIEAIQRCASDGFEIRIFATSKEFVAEVRHPEQLEEFLADTLVELVRDISEWIGHCDQGK
jgi:hypothetical protein